MHGLTYISMDTEIWDHVTINIYLLQYFKIDYKKIIVINKGCFNAFNKIVSCYQNFKQNCDSYYHVIQ